MKVRLYLILLVFLSASSLYAQVEDSEAVTEQSSEEISTSTYNATPSELPPTKDLSQEAVTLRKFDDSKWKKVVGSTDYNKSKSKKKSANGQDDDRPASRRQQFEEPEDDEDSSISLPWAGPLMEIIFYGLIIAVIGAILYYIIKNTSFKSKPKLVKADLSSAPVEDISTLDIDSLLDKTLAAGDYRLALRISFLGLLKKLNETGFILWKKDKTNRDYLTELYSRPNYFDEVRKLTLAYEQVWYGEHNIPAERYYQLKAEFNVIDQQLNIPQNP